MAVSFLPLPCLQLELQARQRCHPLMTPQSNSPPQSQVTPVMLKRTTSMGLTPSVVAVDQREDVEDPRDWDVQRVKVWAKALFNDEGIARKFDEEEIEECTLQSERILSDASMDNLGLSTIGKKDKFATAIQDLCVWNRLFHGFWHHLCCGQNLQPIVAVPLELLPTGKYFRSDDGEEGAPLYNEQESYQNQPGAYSPYPYYLTSNPRIPYRYVPQEALRSCSPISSSQADLSCEKSVTEKSRRTSWEHAET
ncbi:hypothetical protein pdam_00023454, partial [Pocillopora damicornis]